MAPFNTGAYSGESEAVERTFNGLIDALSFSNPNISYPYLEVENKGNGVYEVTILVHIQQPKGEFSDGETI